MEKKALGKGLGALLPESLPKILPIEREATLEIPLERIVPNRYQPRQTFKPGELSQLLDTGLDQRELLGDELETRLVLVPFDLVFEPAEPHLVPGGMSVVVLPYECSR